MDGSGSGIDVSHPTEVKEVFFTLRGPHFLTRAKPNSYCLLSWPSCKTPSFKDGGGDHGQLKGLG